MEHDQYLFDPVQFKEFGLNFVEGDGFICRHQKTKRRGITNIYIPWGPNCESKEGLINFLQYLETIRFSSIRVDVPLIFDEKIEQEVLQAFKNSGYKLSDYVTDGETILIQEHNCILDTKEIRYYCRKAEKSYRVEIKDILTEEEITQMYEVYVNSADRIHYTPKSIDVFRRLAKSTISALSHNLETGIIEAFVMGYRSKAYTQGEGKYGENPVVLRIMFIGANIAARDNYTGYLMHRELFREAFEKYEVDIIDFHGVSRKINLPYVKFKQKFGGDFVSMPGSFRRINIHRFVNKFLN